MSDEQSWQEGLAILRASADNPDRAALVILDHLDHPGAWKHITEYGAVDWDGILAETHWSGSQKALLQVGQALYTGRRGSPIDLGYICTSVGDAGLRAVLEAMQAMRGQPLPTVASLPPEFLPPVSGRG